MPSAPATDAYPDSRSTPMARHALKIGRMQSLSHFGSPYLLANGKVCVVSLEAIARRFGSRWTQRQEIVREHCNKVFRRELGVDALFEWVSDSTVMVAQPSCIDFVGQAKCFGCLKEILEHFLGESKLPDLVVHTVTSLSSTEIVGQRLDAERVMLAARRQPPQRRDTTARTHQSSPFLTSAGRRVRVSCQLEPLIQLKSCSRIGFRASRRVIDVQTEAQLTAVEVGNFSRSDILQVDAAAIGRGLERLRREVNGARTPTLIIPISYSSLSYQEGFSTIVELLKESASEIQHGAICEITDYETAPAGALSSALSVLRPYCAHVVGRGETVRPGAMGHSNEREIVSGVGYECPPVSDEATFIDWAKGVLLVNGRARPNRLLFQVSDLRMVALAAALGASHASLTPRPVSGSN